MKLLLILVFVSLLALSVSCKCIQQSVEKYFCNSQFTIKIKVNSERQITDHQSEAYYDIEVLKVYKSSPKAKSALDSGRIWTADSSAACGRYFEAKEIYVITGSVDETGAKATTHSCTFGRNFEELSSTEKQFFNKKYKSDVCPKAKVSKRKG
jgi:hypothetical protein